MCITLFILITAHLLVYNCRPPSHHFLSSLKVMYLFNSISYDVLFLYRYFSFYLVSVFAFFSYFYFSPVSVLEFFSVSVLVSVD